MELEALLAQALIASHNGDQVTAEKLLKEVATDPDHDRQSLRWEAQASLADLYVQERKTGLANSEYLTALDTVRAARCSIQHEDLRLPFFANATRVYNAYIDFLVGQGRSVEALQAADESRALTLAEGLGLGGKNCRASRSGFDPKAVARRAGATVLFYWLGPEHSYLWAVSPTAVKLFPLPPSGEIEPAIQAYRKALLGPRDPLRSGNGAGDENGAKLYDILLAPAAQFFRPDAGKAPRVIVIADGSLNGLNFETLIAPNPAPHYWIEDVTLRNASSLRMLAAAPVRRSRSGGKLLLIGNALAPKGEFAELPNAAIEMRSVGKYFPPDSAQVYERGNATAAAYLANHPERFAYIHFVAHGTASLSSPLDSAVVLSPSGLAQSSSGPASPDTSDSANDGGYKLYARDIIAHPLRAELVTVSTCYGMGARAYTGEGLVGLSWAFLRAGAHNVIGALWEVSDSSTPQLMETMYGGLEKGSSPDAALRGAKLALLHSGGVYRKPYYWAAFQLYTGS